MVWTLEQLLTLLEQWLTVLEQWLTVLGEVRGLRLWMNSFEVVEKSATSTDKSTY